GKLTARAKRSRGFNPNRGSTSPEVTVVSWNVLCPKNCNTETFKNTNPKDLDNDVRFQRVKEKLEAKMESNAVICLQELSLDWSGRLHTFFQKRQYYMTSTNYGHEKDDYMGVGIAFPMRSFELRDCSIRRVSDALPRVQDQSESPFWKSKAR
ncbi:unnamed protein product, partial [Effrenium voratum]